MSDRARKIPDVRVNWTAERESRVLASLHGRQIRRARLRTAGVIALSSAAVAISFVSVRAALRPGAAEKPVAVVASAATSAYAPAPARSVLLVDGSVAERLDDRTRLRVVEDARMLAVVELDEGAARFDVRPNPSRPFRVRAGPVTVEVLGTAFTVSREAGKITTAVERGHVRVERGNERVDLHAGNTLTLVENPEPPPLPPAPATADGAARSASTIPAPQAPASSAVESWAALAREGEFDRAYDVMRKTPSPRRDDAGELLLEADVARLSGHHAEAIAPLLRIVDGHPRDARAPLAAFTLGRVLLDEVGRPNDAADAFARARALAPDGPLAEDALAREVEAWWRFGDTDRAHARAVEYTRLHPSGTKLKSVRRFGGLD
jgi:transmembrane sensor